MGAIEMITQRKTELLKTLVGDYIESANPVASESVARRHALGVSPATVRNDMADLEEQGYITRPHHSAGAVPLDKGYRFYVESMPAVEDLPPESRDVLRHEFTKAEPDIEVWTRLAATLLAQMVNNVGMVTYPRETESRLMRINLVPIQESLAFLILVLQEVKLRKQLLTLSEPLTGDDLQIVANKLSETLSGRNRQEIIPKIRDMSPIERSVAESVVDIMEAEDRALYTDHYIEGLRHLLSQPEFSEGGKAREIVDVLEEKDLPRVVLAEAPERGSIRVVIGEENSATFLRPLSIVVCRYGLPGGGQGTITAIGPTRMEYSHTMAGVSFISSLMTELVSQVYG